MTLKPPIFQRSTGVIRGPLLHGAAVGVALATVLMRVWLLQPLLGSGNAYIQSYPAILVGAWMSGLAGGLLATFTSGLCIAYFILPPSDSLRVQSLPDRMSLMVFIGIGSLISVLFHAQQRARFEARKSEERYRALVELSPDAVLVHASGTIVYANASAMRLLGASDPSQVVGRSPLDFVAPESRQLAERRIAELLSGAKRVPPIEQQWVRLHGGPLPVEVTAGVVPWGNSEAIQVILRDISARRHADEQHRALLQQAQTARDQAEAANRLKEEFLAVLSHELRTPLNAVLGWARIIKRGVSRADHFTHALTVIERNAATQVRIVEDLLDLSHVVTGQFRLTVQATDLRDAITNAVDSVRPAALAKDIALKLAIPLEHVTVLGDPVRLQQVFWNLLGNAVKFTDPGGLVSVTLRHLGREAQVIVSDTGVGIAPEFLPHCFDRFRQQDSSTTRARPGLGLGLSLARYLVEAHGGHIEAASPGVGCGATFRLVLPVALAADLEGRARQDVSQSGREMS